jgi:hypothetical protein
VSPPNTTIIQRHRDEQCQLPTPTPTLGACRGAIDLVGQRLSRWLAERTTADPARATRVGLLHRDFVAWANGVGEPAMSLAIFARRLRTLGIEARLNARNRGSEFRLSLLPNGSEATQE